MHGARGFYRHQTKHVLSRFLTTFCISSARRGRVAIGNSDSLRGQGWVKQDTGSRGLPSSRPRHPPVVFRPSSSAYRTDVLPYRRAVVSLHGGNRQHTSVTYALMVTMTAVMTTSVIIIMSRLYMQMITVAIHGCRMVVVVTTCPPTAHIVRAITIDLARVAAVSDRKRTAWRIPGVANTQPRAAVHAVPTTVPALR